MTQRIRNSLAALGTVLFLVALASPAAADRYDPQSAGHPIRIAAYFLHPVGVVLDMLLFRPAHWVISHEPLASLTGHEPYLD